MCLSSHVFIKQKILTLEQQLRDARAQCSAAELQKSSMQRELETVKAQLAHIKHDSHERLDALNAKMHQALMKLAKDQFTELNSFEIDDGRAPSSPDAASSDSDSSDADSADADSADAAPSSHAPPAPASPTAAPQRVSTRSSNPPPQQVLVRAVPFTPENLLSAIHRAEPAIFDVGDVISAARIQSMLSTDQTAYRTTTNTRIKFHTVFQDQNGLHRIEEGPHEYPWRAGTAQDIIDYLFPSNSDIFKSWQLVSQLRAFDSGDIPATISHVMMVSGNSTNMLVEHEDHGGVKVTRKFHKVWCHYDDVHNFTWVFYGCKTFIVAPPHAVPPGAPPHVSENRSADTSTPLFRKAVVSAGQLLYLPKGWWHEVRSYSFNLRVLSAAYSDIPPHTHMHTPIHTLTHRSTPTPRAA